MAPIRSTESMALECIGCKRTYVVARQANYEALERAEAWMQTHERCASRPAFAVEPRAQEAVGDDFRRGVADALSKIVAQLPPLASLLDTMGLAGADVVREQQAVIVALLAALKQHA